MEKSIFCCFAGGRQTWKNCKTWKNAFFAGFREDPNAIQRYPSLSQTLEKLQNLEKCIFRWFAGGPKLGKIAKPGKMYFLLVCGTAPTLSNAIRPYPKPLKNCKTWKNAFFAGLREGPTAIQRYPSLSQTLEKLQNLEKCIFGYFAGGRKTFEKLQNLQKCIFFWFPGRSHPTLSVLISDPRKIAKPGKKHFLLFCGRSQNFGKIAKPGKMHFFCFAGMAPNAIQRYPSLSQTLEKLQNLEKSIFCCFAGGFKTWLQNLEKCIFCWFPGRLQHYPTLSVLILDPRKNCKTWKNSFFYWFAGGPKLGKIAKPGKMYFLLLCGRAPTLSNAIRPYPRPQKNCKTWKNAFFAGLPEGQNLEKLQNLEKCIFCCFAGEPQRYPTLSVIIRDPKKNAKPGKMIFLLVSGKGSTLSNAIRPYLRP